jgi:hypothetical protein
MLSFKHTIVEGHPDSVNAVTPDRSPMASLPEFMAERVDGSRRRRTFASVSGPSWAGTDRTFRVSDGTL